MKLFPNILLFIFLLSGCKEHQETNSSPETLESLPYFQSLNQHFIVESLPKQLSDSLKNLKGWKQSEGATIYPLLAKTANQSGFLSSEYGDCSNLFLVRQKHALGGGGHYDILFTLDPETGKLIDQITVGEESYLTSLRHQTIWVDHLDNYVFHVYGVGKIDSLNLEECLENEDETICQEPISKYFLIDDNWHFQPLKEHKISKGRLFPFLSNQFLEAYELKSYDKARLELMSAEIYAQYGYSFEDSELKAHFNQQEWYHPRAIENVEELLSDFEQHNLNLIQAQIIRL